MSRIVFAWELGENHGHLWRLLPIALEMRRRGHTVTFVLGSMALARRFLAPRDIAFFPCPAPTDSPALGREIASYSDILALSGAFDHDLLAGMALAWRHLYRQLAPDMVVIDHAPTALLAARRDALPSLQVGTGFTIPPLDAAALRFRRLDDAQERAHERLRVQVRDNIAAVLGRPLSLAQTLAADVTRLTTLPELDHYAGWRPQPAVFCGAVPEPDTGPVVPWRQQRRPRVLLYLQNTHWLPGVLDGLRKAACEVIAVVPGMPDTLPRDHARDGAMRFFTHPVRLEPLLAQCDLAITHAGHGTALNCLCAGVPLLMLPTHIEQLLVTERVAAAGAGIGLFTAHVATGFAPVLETLLSDGRYRQAAGVVAARYAHLPRAQALDALATLIDTMVRDAA